MILYTILYNHPHALPGGQETGERDRAVRIPDLLRLPGHRERLDTDRGPQRGGLGLTADIRDQIPFHSFLPVGLFLFFVYGIGGLLLAYGSLTRKELFMEFVSERSGRHWSWTGGVLLMAILVV